ncbi:unnamed protein product [Alopecurus aequalis]
MSGWFQPKAEEPTTGGSLGEKTEAAKKAAIEAADAAKQKATETVQSVQDRAVESKDQTGGFLSDKTEAAKKAAVDAADAAKQKANETAQYVEDRASDAAEYTKADPPVAAKDDTGNVFQQAGGQVMGAAVGAKDAVMNTLGMGGDAAAEKK